MVYPVQVVPLAPRTGRENGSSKRQQSEAPRSGGFAAALEKAMAEEQPMTCHTVTYNAARELRTFYYRPSREYTL